MHDPRDYFTIKRGKVRLKSKRQHRYLHAQGLSHSHYEYRGKRGFVYKREKLSPHRHAVPKAFRGFEARE